jgi:hypothetical protein
MVTLVRKTVRSQENEKEKIDCGATCGVLAPTLLDARGDLKNFGLAQGLPNKRQHRP